MIANAQVCNCAEEFTGSRCETGGMCTINSTHTTLQPVSCPGAWVLLILRNATTPIKGLT